MARRRKKQTRRSRSRYGALGLYALAALGFVGVLAAGLSLLDPVGRWLSSDTPAATRQAAKTAPERIGALPNRMQVPDNRPSAPQASRKETGEPARPRPAKAVAASNPAGRSVAPDPAPATTASIRPPVNVGSATSKPAPAPVAPAGMKPARKAQEGNCACPYDLMLDGTVCGARSSYLTPGREKPICYR